MILKLLISLLLGYSCGNILTAEIVARKVSGKSVFALGSGNPGMANVMTELGFGPGAATLAGDLAKTVIPCLISRFIIIPEMGMAGAAFAGLGAVLGHNFPVWHHFKGGMGVSCTCAAMFMVQPAAGLLSMIVGMYVTFAAKYLSAGAVLIPGTFAILSGFLFGPYVCWPFIIMTVLMFIAHFKNLSAMVRGTGKRVDVLKNANQKFGKYTAVIFLVISFVVDVLLVWFLAANYFV